MSSALPLSTIGTTPADARGVGRSSGTLVTWLTSAPRRFLSSGRTLRRHDRPKADPDASTYTDASSAAPGLGGTPIGRSPIGRLPCTRRRRAAPPHAG